MIFYSASDHFRNALVGAGGGCCAECHLGHDNDGDFLVNILV